MNPSRSFFAPRILITFDGHGAYVRDCGYYYLLCAAELNQCLEPGTTWDDPEARIPAVIRLIAEIAVEPHAATLLGSFRLEDLDDYRRHRRRLSKMLRAARTIAKWHKIFEEMAVRRA